MPARDLFRRARAWAGNPSIFLALLALASCNEILGNHLPMADDDGAAGSASGGLGGADGGGSTGGGAGDSSGGSGNTGGASSVVTVAALGDACGEPGVMACAGHAQKQRLICEEGAWADNGECQGDRHCDTAQESAGICRLILPECLDLSAGDSAGSCDEGVPQVCGVDLVSLADGTACEAEQVCFGGQCATVAEVCEGLEEGDPVEECVGNAPALCGPELLSLVPDEECGDDFACVDGSCEAIVEECRGHADGDAVCSLDGTESFECGPRGLTKSNVTACDQGFCSAGACGAPPSCAGMDGVCGPDSAGDCCEAIVVTAGEEFYRGFDTNYPATISDFRLDKYEVTVGRFRNFVQAMVDGWQPSAGSGKHTHLNGGNGLTEEDDVFESGWQTAWTTGTNGLYWGSVSKGSWDSALQGGGSCNDSSWTADPGPNETKPIGCLQWFQAYAFCIWDGGFLPSEFEWEYAATGGPQELYYPWGSAEASPDRATYDCQTQGDALCDIDDDLFGVGSKPDGNSPWGHSDLAGSMREWVLDWNVGLYVQPCVDCARLSEDAGGQRGLRGGDWVNATPVLAGSNREGDQPSHNHEYIGVRCARTP